MDQAPSRLVAGRYRLQARLGAGGMGTVWRATDEVLGRDVAVKEVTFPAGLTEHDREVLRERTRREARAAARLDHPSAVTVYDVVEDGGAPYLVMELVEARTLAEVVRSDGPLSPQRTAQVGLALLGALEAAHRSGIVHRDVKPSNVLVRDDGRVVLTDFGIATTTGDPSITSTGLLLGSPAYLSPERARGEAPGPPADLWSLGATLFTAVEGRPPYDQDSALLTVAAVVTGEHAPFAAAGPLEPVLDGLLTKDPERRLDAAAARPLLQEVADRGPSEPTRALPVAAPVAAPAPVRDPGRAAARTTALDVGAVRREVAAAGPARPSARPAVRPAAGPAPSSGVPRWLLPVAAAAVVLGVAAGGWALADGDDPDGTVDPGVAAPAASPSAAASPAAPSPTAAPPVVEEPSPEPEPEEPEPAEPEPEEPAVEDPGPGQTGGAAAVPAGWTTDEGSSGWTVALPPGYVQTRPGEYRQRETERTLRVETGEGQPDAVADRRRAAEGFASRNPAYTEIRIEPVDYRGYEAADWEFTYEGLHVLNRVFVVDGVGHSLWLQAREEDFPQARADFAAIADAFVPVGR